MEQVKTIKVDIGVNKFLELQNSELIRTYCMLDARFRECALVLKHWMKLQKGYNSYTVYMLLLAVMIEKDYLPNLMQ